MRCSRTRWCCLPIVGLVAGSLVVVSARDGAGDPLAAILEHRAAGLVENGRSAGCGLAPAHPPDAIDVDGRGRRLIVVLPEPYDPDVAHALVIAFHGRTSPAATVRRYYDLERHVTRPTIFVYPSGLPGGPDRFTWSGVADRPDELRDYRLFDAIVRRMTSSYCIDRQNIFAVGHSLGAWFANSIACARGDVLRGIGTLGGSISAGTCRGEAAAIVLHNPRDRLVPYRLGQEVRDHLRGQNGLRDGGRLRVHRGFTCIRYGGGESANPVLWCPHHRDRTARGRFYPHGWPRGTGAAIMAFFEALPPP